MQNIWRTVSVPDHNGVFVWEVMEYADGLKPENTEGFVEFRDKTWGFPLCYHYFTNVKAEEHLNEQFLSDFGAVYHTI